MTFITIEEPPLTPFEFFGEDSVKRNVIKAFNEKSNRIKSLWMGNELSGLHSNPIFMPKELIGMHGLEILVVFLTCAILHFSILTILKRNKPSSKNIEQWRESTQLLNMVVNLFLGILGIYYHFILRSSPESIENTVNQWEHFGVFGVGQAGFQMWSIVVGLWKINEPVTMILHHISVVCVALISVVFNNGFRYYTAFFYGVAEISSFPLALMNIFKNDSSLAQKYPTWNMVIKVAFAVSFLLVRVFLWTPLMYTFLRLSYSLSSTCPTMLCFVYLRTFMVCAAFLTCLQLYWAKKIIKGLLLMLGLIEKKNKFQKGISSFKEE